MSLHGITIGRSGKVCGLAFKAKISPVRKNRPILATVLTTPDGVIEGGNAAAADLLNCSSTRCRGRSLINFFAKNRVDILKAMAAARADQMVHGSGVIRPRERRPHQVVFTVAPDPEQDGSLKWVFEARDHSPHP